MNNIKIGKEEQTRKYIKTVEILSIILAVWFLSLAVIRMKSFFIRPMLIFKPEAGADRLNVIIPLAFFAFAIMFAVYLWFRYGTGRNILLKLAFAFLIAERLISFCSESINIDYFFGGEENIYAVILTATHILGAVEVVILILLIFYSLQEEKAFKKIKTASIAFLATKIISFVLSSVFSLAMNLQESRMLDLSTGKEDVFRAVAFNFLWSIPNLLFAVMLAIFFLKCPLDYVGKAVEIAPEDEQVSEPDNSQDEAEETTKDGD